jgi:low affinity Fe/Cu permease
METIEKPIEEKPIEPVVSKVKISKVVIGDNKYLIFYKDQKELQIKIDLLVANQPTEQDKILEFEQKKIELVEEIQVIDSKIDDMQKSIIDKEGK